MTATINPKTSLKLINDSWDKLYDCVTAMGARKELDKYFKMEKTEANAHPKIINKVQWAKAMILENVIDGANNPNQDLTYMYGQRDSISLAMIWGARYKVNVRALRLDRAAISTARLDTQI